MNCFTGWKLKFIEWLDNTISSLKERYTGKLGKVKSVFSDPNVKKDLNYFHNHFVLCPVEKASKNIAVVCKHYYLSTLINECLRNTQSYSSITDISIDDICSNVKKFMSNSCQINVSSLDNSLPHMVLFPKFHKPRLSQRFVVSYSNCTVKPLAKGLTLALKAVYKKICSYSDMIFKVTGINRNWIIDNNTKLLDCMSNIDYAKNIYIYMM